MAFPLIERNAIKQMQIFRRIITRLQARRVPCHCGGHIIEHFIWADYYFACDKCGREITYDEFEARYR
jgi:hypothetical protein